MKKHSRIVLGIGLITLCSWAMSKSVPNTDSWSIRIGEKELLASWKNNKMGDMATLDKKRLRSVDTLVLQRYLCGYNGRNAVTTVTIKKQRNGIIKKSTTKNNGLIFTGKMPLTDILSLQILNNPETIAVYFTIESKAEKINETVLLGKLRFK